MKRDLVLIKKILEKLEAIEPFSKVSEFKVEGYSEKLINYHIKILDEAGYIKAQSINEKKWLPFHLTWSGHEFLNLLRNEKFMKKVLNKFKTGLPELPFEFIKVLAVKFLS